ncbi:MAG TPA: hypothetical protein VNZ57_00055 [Longimicrobiales bacterium]|nr:hypothetical protein [Longimicrobiales bacterium]
MKNISLATLLTLSVALTGCATLFRFGEGHIPPATYWVYVGSEAADLLQRVRYGPDGAVVEQTSAIGELETEIEGPHGLAISPDGRHVYVSTGHGLPDGKLWKFEAGPDTLVADPIPLDRFPATVSVTPNGLYAFVANQALYGEPGPSSLSVVFTPEMIETHRIETCGMPHGGRFSPDGRFHYSVCTLDGLLVEVDATTFAVTRRLELGSPPPVAPAPGAAPTTPPTPCSPTWVAPVPEGSTLWIACDGSNEVLEVDLEQWWVVRRVPVGGGPYELAISPDGRWLVVTLRARNAVQFLDLTWITPPVIVPTTSVLPHGVAISPDSRYAFVSVEGRGGEPGLIEIYLLETAKRVATIAVGPQPAEIAVWRYEEGVATD